MLCVSIYIYIIAFASSIILALLYFAILHPPIRREQLVHLKHFLHYLQCEANLVEIMHKGTTQQNDDIYSIHIQTYHS